MKSVYLLIGFLTNSVLLRVTGRLPDDDIFYPLVILFMMVLLAVIQRDNQKRTGYNVKN